VSASRHRSRRCLALGLRLGVFRAVWRCVRNRHPDGRWADPSDKRDCRRRRGRCNRDQSDVATGSSARLWELVDDTVSRQTPSRFGQAIAANRRHTRGRRSERMQASEYARRISSEDWEIYPQEARSGRKISAACALRAERKTASGVYAGTGTRANAPSRAHQNFLRCVDEMTRDRRTRRPIPPLSPNRSNALCLLSARRSNSVGNRCDEAGPNDRDATIPSICDATEFFADRIFIFQIDSRHISGVFWSEARELDAPPGTCNHVNAASYAAVNVQTCGYQLTVQRRVRAGFPVHLAMENPWFRKTPRGRGTLSTCSPLATAIHRRDQSIDLRDPVPRVECCTPQSDQLVLSDSRIITSESPR